VFNELFKVMALTVFPDFRNGGAKQIFALVGVVIFKET